MASECPYGTFANYSPRGTSELSVKSRAICGRIKGCDVAVINSALQYLAKHDIQVSSASIRMAVMTPPGSESHGLPLGRSCIRLSMPVVLRVGGLRFLFYSNEGSPREQPHIHVLQDRDEAKFRLRPEVSGPHITHCIERGQVPAAPGSVPGVQ